MIWFTGPHIGVRHDSKLFETHPPPLENGEQWLADLAYVKHGRLKTCVCAYKKQPGKQLTKQQSAFNVMHSWYRCTVEHTIAYVKRFKILGGIFRGKVWENSQFIQNVATIIFNCATFHVNHTPMRVHRNLQHQPDQHELDQEEKIDVVETEEMEVESEVNISTSWEEKFVDTSSINTTFEINDFQIGDEVEFFDGWRWKKGKIKYISKREKTISIISNQQYIKGIPPFHAISIYN